MLTQTDKKTIQIQKISRFIGDKITVTPFKSNEKSEERFNLICSKGLLKVLLNMGLNDYCSTKIGFSELHLKLGFEPKFDKLFLEAIRYLSTVNLIQLKDQSFSIKRELIEELDTFEIETVFTKELEHNSEYAPHAKLITICLNAFEDIVKGVKIATDVMFPNGSLEYVAEIYKGNYQADYFNELLAQYIADSVERTIPNLKNGEKIKLLEVGAGTGGTSEIIFQKLKSFSDHVEYWYTDVSKSFLIYAEKQYKDMAPYMKTALFNIEMNPVNQGLPIGEFDIVIAANVVHATRDIVNTLDNIKPTLKKEGVIVLNELAKTEIFSTLTFGLLDGWGLYEDKEIRLKGSPGLSPKGWGIAFLESGFRNVASYPKQDNIPQQIVLAQSDGIALLKEEKSVTKKNTVEVNRSTKGVDPKVIKELIQIAALTIKLPASEFESDKQFTDYGFDSILGMSLVKNINDGLKIDLKPTDIFNNPNIELLAEYICDNYPDLYSVQNISENKLEIQNVTEDGAIKLTENRRKNNGKIQNSHTELYTETNGDIAVIGMSGQFGKANNLEEFWNSLKNGESLVEEVPDFKWNKESHFSEKRNEKNKTYSKWGSFLRDVDKFDPQFFKISGSEAEMMDPQQRLFLEHCWKAIEDAAIHPSKLKAAKCGVFVGASAGDYIDTIDDKEASVFWGNSSSILASRISYLLDLKGPAISIDTACSSSLVAIDMGCSSLLSGATDLIISGGITIMNTPNFYKLSSRAGMLSPDGTCYAFDSRANGFVPGEGVGVVLLKRMNDALRDGDHIYGVIKTSRANQDGKTNGLIAPSSVSQHLLEKEVYSLSNINPETISYVETHGTGTSLGDPIEFDALSKSFKLYTDKKQFCSIGSVKTNVGHTLMAAGVAGLIKVMLQFKYKLLVPSINFETANPLIDFENSPFKIQQKSEPWEVGNEYPRRATVSSFGFSGTNVHMLLEEYDSQAIKSKHVNMENIFLLSAKTKERLRKKVEEMLLFLSENKVEADDLMYTLQQGREEMDERLSFIASSIDEIRIKLENYLNENFTDVYCGNAKKDKSEFSFEGTAGQAYIDFAVKNKELQSLAQLWVKNTSIDWNILYDNEKPNRISLPVYPFARESYWMHKKGVLVESSQKENELSLMTRENTEVVLPPMEKNIQNGEEVLLDIIADVLKIKKEKIDLQADFDELGMDSVLIYSFMHELEKRQMSISMAELMSCKNIEDLLFYFKESDTITTTLKREEKYWEVLKNSEGENSTKSVIIIPGTPGISFPYLSIANAINTSSEVIGLNWKGVFDHEPFQSIKEVAIFNLEQIKQKLGNCSIDLIGHSYGALIVYEMLKNAEKMGIIVDEVILIDSTPKLLSKSMTERQLLLMLLDVFGWNETQVTEDQLLDIVENMLQKTMDEKIDYFQSIQLMLDNVKMPQNLNKEITASIFNSYMTTMSIKYNPKKKINKKVTVIKAKNDNVVKVEEMDQGWKKLFQEVEVIHAEGDHYTIIQKGTCEDWCENMIFNEEIFIN